MLDPPFVYRGGDVHDQHRDMRLDVDNMSYEVWGVAQLIVYPVRNGF